MIGRKLMQQTLKFWKIYVYKVRKIYKIEICFGKLEKLRKF